MEFEDLQVADDEKFSRREAKVERAAWLVIAALLLAALLGLFANGPLSHRKASGEGVELRYQRFARNQGRTTLQVRVDPGATQGGAVVVAVSKQFLQAYEVEEVFPAPSSVRAGRDAVEYAFEVDDGAALEASIRLRPDRPGHQRGVVSVAREQLTFKQLVYP